MESLHRQSRQPSVINIKYLYASQVGGTMSRRPTAAPHNCDEEKFMELLDSNEPYALVRFQANQIFHVSIFHGVDTLTDRAKALFDAIPPSALAISPEASDRDILYKSLKMWMTIIQLAVFNGRADLERM